MAGMVNGLASVSVILMSALTSKLVGLLGWPGLLLLLGGMLAAAAALAVPAVNLERAHFAAKKKSE